MSVLTIYLAAVTYVQTLLVAMYVAVTVDSHWTVTGRLALVQWNLKIVTLLI